MKKQFTLFDSHPFLNPLDAAEALEVQKLLKWFSQFKKHIPSIHLPEKITDHLLYCFLKALHNNRESIHPQAWQEFLETLFTHRLMSQLSCPSLRHYLLIQLAKTHHLSNYIDSSKCLKLAYVAVHSGRESRCILLNHAKHFNITDQNALADLAFKGILLGGALDIDLNQFMPMRCEVLKQLIFLIGRIDQNKALLELKKLGLAYPGEVAAIESILKAS